MILEFAVKHSQQIRNSVICLLACLCILSFSAVQATENILVYPDVRHLNISNYITNHDASKAIKIATIRPEKGEKKFINILSADTSEPQWISFALTNPTKVAIQRLLVVPHYGGGNDGLFGPILSGTRISQLYSSSGGKPDLQMVNGHDIFLLNLPAEKTLTFVARVADNLPTRIALWEPDAYKSHQSYLPFYQGLIIGIIGLLAIFVSSLFIVKRDILFVVAAAICWSALAYSLQEFGFLTVVLPENTYLLALIRAISEIAINSLPLLLLYVFFYKSYEFDIEKIIILSPLIIALIALLLAFISPSVATSIARLNAILVAIMGFVFIIKHWPTEKFSTAQTLLPIWFVFALWAIAQIYMAVSVDILYLNLFIGAIYILFLLMTFMALLQDFTVSNMASHGHEMIDTPVNNDTDYIAPFDETIAANATNIPNIAITGSGQVLWEWDLLKGRIKCGNELDDLLGYPHGTTSCIIHDWIGFLHLRDAPKFENILSVILEEGNSRIDQDLRLRAVNGDYLWFELRAIALTDDEGYLVSFVGTLNEVTIRKSTEDRLFQDAVHDNLTGLPNRSLFIDRLERAMSRAMRKESMMPAILLIDINRFKAVNSSVGIAMGDSLLMMIARRLEKYTADNDTVARVGGDQFAILLTDYSDINSVVNFGEKIRKIIAMPINMENKEIVLTTSIGVVLGDASDHKTDDLIHKAELALNTAKQKDNKAVTIYSIALNGSKGDKFARENDLRQALARNEFEMLYQPIISLETMRPVGFEALIRWHHPTEGDILPSDFIELAEETGHIHELGKFALSQAAKQLNIWQRTFKNDTPLFVSVNMSSMELFQPKLVEQVQDVLKRFNVVKSTLKLEVTETLVMKNPELARQILNRLKDIGAGLAVDDFGTGYSSLSYLHQFPFDIIKIDRSFISGENFGKTRPIILKSIIQLARDLGLKVIAEGVEKDEQAHELIDLGCELVQGYRFGEPMSAKDSLNFLSANFV